MGARVGQVEAGRGAIVLLVQNEAGYRNLMRLASCTWLEPAAGDLPHVSFARLAEHAEGLIALTGGPEGAIDTALRRERADAAAARLARLAALFAERLYVELQRHGEPGEAAIEQVLLDLAARFSLPPVATNEPFFGSSGDHDAHDALIAIAEGTLLSDSRRRRVPAGHLFRTRAEMQALFADLPQATDNSVAIAMRCAFRPKTAKPILPRYTSIDGAALDEVAELRAQAAVGLAARLAKHGPANGLSVDDYAERLEFELGVIIKMGFPGYFLIVADFIKFAKEQGIPVGPGRGSGAGSLVAYSLTITDLDPLRYGLFFERFLNPERVSMPDFDIDFCQTRREEVIKYVRDRYGRDRVAQIITFGSFLARGVLRNVGRVLEMPLGQVDRLAKLIPQNPAKPVTLQQAIDGEQKLREAAEAEPRVAALLKIAQTLEGLYSNASTHAAGIVIGDRPLDELVPLYRDPKSDMPATQFNMKWVEPAGLVKFDFLGLKTLTVLAETVRLLKQRDIIIDLSEIPLDDTKTFEALGRGEVVGVFQVESAGMKKALIDMRADRLEDLIALVALYRPGPMANIPTYCQRKLGEEEVTYTHPLLEPILKETFGVITYQEQVMQIAQVLSGYSLGEADMLRRAMGKKIKAEMDAQRDRFVNGAIERGISKPIAVQVFDACAKFAEYGFNKGHSAPYALLTYQTAWLKANYPVEFLAASMTLDKSNTDKLAEFRTEARRLGIAVETPSINRSGVDFAVHVDAGGSLGIRYGLAAVKGVGDGQAGALVAARGAGPFTNLADVAARLNPREVNKKVVENLAAAGAFDELDPNRARVFKGVDTIMASANRQQGERLAGQSALFGTQESDTLALPQADPWSQAERLRREFDAVGFFLSGHPLDAYGSVLQRLRVERWTDFSRTVKQAGESTARLAVTVIDRAERRTRQGSKMGIFALSDPSGQFEAIMFQEGLNQFRDVLEKGAVVLVSLHGAMRDDEVRVRIIEAEPLEAAAGRVQKGLRIFLRDEKPVASIARRLTARGEGEVSLVLMMDQQKSEVEVRLPGRFQVTAQIAGALKSIPGIVAVEHI